MLQIVGNKSSKSKIFIPEIEQVRRKSVRQQYIEYCQLKLNPEVEYWLNEEVKRSESMAKTFYLL